MIYPTPTGGAAPTITRLAIPGAAVLRVDDTARDCHVLVVVRAPAARAFVLSPARTGLPISVTTDAAITVVEVHGNGAPITSYFEQGTHLHVTRVAPLSRAR